MRKSIRTKRLSTFTKVSAQLRNIKGKLPNVGYPRVWRNVIRIQLVKRISGYDGEDFIYDRFTVKSDYKLYILK